MSAIDLPRDAPDTRIVPAWHWAAVALAAYSIVDGLVALRLGLTASDDPGLVRQNAIGTVATFVLIVTLVIVGLILRRSRRDHPMGWLFLLFAAAVGQSAALWGGTYVSGLLGGDRELGQIAAWFGAVSTLPTWTFLATSIIVRFPTGYPESKVEARLLRIAGVACLVVAIGLAFRPGPFVAFSAYTNPLRVSPELGQLVSVAVSIAVVAAFLPSVLAVTFMIGRYRRASLTGRLQLRWFGFAGGLTFVVGWAFVASDLLLSTANPVRELGYAALVLAACSLPIAVLQAIMRHRLFDIDTIIGRTVAYGTLTAILAGLYAASIRGFQAIFITVTGEESDVALVLTTLILATTFTPIKTYLEKLAAKRFPATLPPEAAAAPDPLVSAPHDDLDARIESIERRVAHDVLAEPGNPARKR